MIKYTDYEIICVLVKRKRFDDDDFIVHPNGVVDFLVGIDWWSEGLESLDDYQIGTVNGEFDVRSNNLESLEGGPVRVTGDYNCSDNRTLESLNFFPKFIGKNCKLGSNDKLTPSAHIPVLFSEIHGEIFTNWLLLDYILKNDRVNGKMPRELIPARINALRDMDTEIKY
jgi:hypothetical protein